MRLKKAIVVVNEYTIKNKNGGGSRGGTPGDYIVRYMARDGATETGEFITPNLKTEAYNGYILDYMARDGATEQLIDLKDMVQNEDVDHSKQDPRWDGVAFNHSNLSLSRKELKKASKEIQKAFDSGKTVLKTVISFDTEYLRSVGVISDDFIFRKKGDFRGHIDQMKLRQALHDGLEALSHDYDNLQYVGVVQVDTEHVHCHLAMCDFGKGSLAKDGTQKGKLRQESIMKLRRRLDASLDETKSVSFMASHADLNKRNLKINIAKLVYSHVSEYGISQILFSTLPEDTKMWTSKSNAKSMQTAHKICRNYVDMVMQNYPDEMTALQQSFQDYINERKTREDLSNKECKQLLQTCNDNFYNDCESVIYKTLKQIPDEYKDQSTDFLTLATDEHLVNSGKHDIQEFVYRLKSYVVRYDSHRKSVKKYDQFISDYESAKAQDGVASESNALYAFFLYERDYQVKMASKYSQMLFVDEPDDDLAEEYMKLTHKVELIHNMKLLRNDPDIKKYKSSETLQAYARDRYGIYTNTDMLRTKPELFDDLIERHETDYDKQHQSFVQELNARSKSVTTDKDGQIKIIKQPAYVFDEIRGLDLHDVRYDFGQTLEFDGEVRQTFIDCATKRLDLYDKACDYLRLTDQEDFIEVFDTDDMQRMREVSTKLQNNEVIVNDKELMKMSIDYKMVPPVDVHMSRILFQNVIHNISNKYVESNDWKTEI